MRTLHADLTTSQQAASATPYVKVTFTSRDGGTTRIYATDDGTNKLVSVQQAEGRYNGHIQMVGSAEFSMVVRIRDADNSIAALDHKGYKCTIDWGFNTSSGNKSSNGPYGFVINQRVVSVLGTVFVEFTCFSAWDILANVGANIEIASVVTLDGTTTIRHALMNLILGGLSAALLDDGGAFTDELTASKDETANDVALLPAAPAVNDAFYFGNAIRFNRISIDLTTVGAGTWTIAWEYYNGSAWTHIESATTTIKAFKTGQLQIVDLLMPSNWATTTINSQGPFYYVRARVSAFTSITTRPLATKIGISYDYGLALDTSDASQGDDYQPIYTSDYQVSRRDFIKNLLEYTLLGMTLLSDGFHLKYINNAQGSADYIYNTSHDSYNSEQSSGLLVPNKIIYVNEDPVLNANLHDGSDENTASSGELGVLPIVIVDGSLQSDAEAVTQAERYVKRQLRDIQQGTVSAPMNCGQEIWDLVTVVDARSGATFSGRVSQLVRTYIPSVNRYNIQIQMGGMASVSRTDYPNRVDLMSETERQATQREEAARAMAGVPAINRGTIDNIVDERLAAMGLGPLVEGEFLHPAISSAGEMRTEAALAVHFFRGFREILASQGMVMSVGDAASLLITSITRGMQEQLATSIIPFDDEF